VGPSNKKVTGPSGGSTLPLLFTIASDTIVSPFSPTTVVVSTDAPTVFSNTFPLNSVAFFAAETVVEPSRGYVLPPLSVFPSKQSTSEPLLAEVSVADVNPASDVSASPPRSALLPGVPIVAHLSVDLSATFDTFALGLSRKIRGCFKLLRSFPFPTILRV